MAKYQEATVKLPNSPLNKLRSAAKSKTRTIFKIDKKNFPNLIRWAIEKIQARKLQPMNPFLSYQIKIKVTILKSLQRNVKVL